jgi:hypothetical protein
VADRIFETPSVVVAVGPALQRSCVVEALVTKRLFVSRVSGACFGVGAWHKHRYNILREVRPRVFSLMPTEVSIPDAEDLKSRARELRRFL